MAETIALNQLNQSARDANKFQGKVWAFPESTEAVALWYNKTWSRPRRRASKNC